MRGTEGREPAVEVEVGGIDAAPGDADVVEADAGVGEVRAVLRRDAQQRAAAFRDAVAEKGHSGLGGEDREKRIHSDIHFDEILPETAWDGKRVFRVSLAKNS